MKPAHFFVLPLLVTAAHGATIAAGNVTTALGPNFFFDLASTGGGDTNAASTVAFNRNLGALNVGAGGTTVSITGFGFASLGNGVTATQVSMTITYLGANGAVGGGDDVLIGTVTDAITGSGTGTEYVWAFNSPLVADIDGANSIFRFEMTTNSTGTLRFKTTSGTDISGAKFSVAGTSTSVVPEPAAAALLGLGALGVLRRRRR